MFLVVLLCLSAATGCADGERFTPPSVPPGDYRAVVSLTPSITEILFALGAADRVAGVTSWCDYPPETAAIPKVGDFIRPNLEAILDLDPDLVILAATGDLLRESYENLVSLDLEVLVVWNNTIEETFSAIGEIGRVLKQNDAAAALLARCRRDLKKQRDILAEVPERSVLWVMGRRPLVAVGEGTYQHELLEAAGCRNVAAGLGSWPTLNPEYVLKIDPDVIIDTALAMGKGDRKASGNSTPWDDFSSLRAVQTENVHLLDGDSLYRPGVRMAEALEILGRALYPERYRHPETYRK